jgi:endo-1,4-beta-xylanase
MRRRDVLGALFAVSTIRSAQAQEAARIEMKTVKSLREVARRRGLAIGSCVDARALRLDSRYAATLSREFSSITPENALKFGPLSPRPGTYDFSDADALVAFAERHKMAVRGHTLVWNRQLPGWLTRATPDRKELTRILVSHVRTVVGRYAGRIAAWDVVNEAIARSGKPRNSIWWRVIGPDYLRIAFEAAHEADPRALLFYNDYGIEATPAQIDAIHALLARLRTQAPVHGIGMQMHIRLADGARVNDLRQQITQAASLGLKIHITELDVRLPIKPRPSSSTLDEQAAIFGDIVKICLATPQCDNPTFWGVTDRYSWIPHFFPGEGAALLFDAEYRAKPGYRAVKEALKQ